MNISQYRWFFDKHEMDIHYVFSAAGFFGYKESSIRTKYILPRKIIFPEQHTFLLSKKCVKLRCIDFRFWQKVCDFLKGNCLFLFMSFYVYNQGILRVQL